MLDTSVLSAIVFGEPDAEALVALLSSREDALCVAAPTLVEASIVVEAKQGPEASADLARLLSAFAVETIPFDATQAAIAAAAWRRFGKGRHPAALNLGDCFSYAAARALGAALAFKGDDFLQTDIEAIAPGGLGH